jgi:hypothetical protein
VTETKEEYLKRQIMFSILFAVSYLIAAFCLLGPFGGAGHGWGIAVFMDISLPAILVAIVVDGIYPHHDLTVWLGLLGGAAQYALVGYLLGRLLRSRLDS